MQQSLDDTTQRAEAAETRAQALEQANGELQQELEQLRARLSLSVAQNNAPS